MTHVYFPSLPKSCVNFTVDVVLPRWMCIEQTPEKV